ncbi:MAG: hypothetical protein ABIR96_13355 [Bdellovibrionota bacterium]
MKNLYLGLFSISAFLFAGCASITAPKIATAPAAAPTPETAESTDPGDGKVGDAWSLHAANSVELSRSVPSVQLAPSTVAEIPEVIFASFEPKDLKKNEEPRYIFRPAIVRKRSKTSPAEFVALDQLARYDWVGAATLASKGLYWGLLDYQVEGTAHSLPIVWSKDAGKSWSLLALVQKRHFSDLFDSFGMDDKGQGFVLFENTDVEDGFYIVETTDFGKSWSKPRFYTDLSKKNKHLRAECSFSAQPVKKVAATCALPAQFLK